MCDVAGPLVTRAIGRTRTALLLGLLLLGAEPTSLAAGEPEPERTVFTSYADSAHDSAPRRTDAGAALTFDPAIHHLP